MPFQAFCKKSDNKWSKSGVIIVEAGESGALITRYLDQGKEVFAIR